MPKLIWGVLGRRITVEWATVILLLVNTAISTYIGITQYQQEEKMEILRKQLVSTVLKRTYEETTGDLSVVNIGSSEAIKAQVRVEVNAIIEIVRIPSDYPDIKAVTEKRTNNGGVIGTLLIFSLPDMSPGKEFAIRLKIEDSNTYPSKSSVFIIPTCSNCPNPSSEK